MPRRRKGGRLNYVSAIARSRRDRANRWRIETLRQNNDDANRQIVEEPVNVNNAAVNPHIVPQPPPPADPLLPGVPDIDIVAFSDEDDELGGPQKFIDLIHDDAALNPVSTYTFLRRKGVVLMDETCDEVDDLIEGKRTYNIEEKLSPKVFNDTRQILKSKGRDVTYESLHLNGFTKPILVKDSDNLGVKMPSHYFSVKDVMKHVGADRVVQVIDASTQATNTWTMERFVDYYTTPRPLRKRIWNVISLEFTGTDLDLLVTSPAVVRELDWAQKAWPLDMLYVDVRNMATEEMTFPKVLKYCLMSVQGCYTDFHIDLGGTSVWYHILKGRKIFWLIPPTEENIQKFITWSTSGKQEETFLGDICSDCQRIAIQEGSTFFIPTGWIHAVYTPMDSLVFGGNFLHSLNIGLQLRVVAIEDKLRVSTSNKYPYFHEMQWYVYDHYNIALTGKSLMSIGGKPVGEMCNIVEEYPVLSQYELAGLKNLREWLPNQDVDTYPDDVDSRQKLLDSMMVALVKHKDDDKKTHSPRKRSMLQWTPTVLEKYISKWRLSIANKVPEASDQSGDSENEDDFGESEEEQPAAAPVAKKRGTVPKRAAASKSPAVTSRKRRRIRCGECAPCLVRDDCQKCLYCRDMKRNGGKGTLKQCCIKRKCIMHTKDNFKVLASKDPKQTKLTSILLSPTSRGIKTKKVEEANVPLCIQVKTEPVSPVKDVLSPSAPKKRQSSGDAPVGRPKKTAKSQKTLTQFYSSPATTSLDGKTVKKKSSSGKFIDDLGPGRHQTAAEFGHTVAHLEGLLKSADTSRLAINGGEVVIYMNEDHDIRVFVKDSQDNPSTAEDSKKKPTNESTQQKTSKPKKRKDPTEETENEPAVEKSTDEAEDEAVDMGDVFKGVTVVPNIKLYLRNAAAHMRKGVTISNKLVFLCKAQTVDNDGGMMFVGHPITVEESTYFYANAVKPSCKFVKIYDEGISISLPLVFPKSEDLKLCMELCDETIIARECPQLTGGKYKASAEQPADCAEQMVVNETSKPVATSPKMISLITADTKAVLSNSAATKAPTVEVKPANSPASSTVTPGKPKPIRVVRIVHPDAASMAASSPISHAKVADIVRFSNLGKGTGQGTKSSVSMVLLPDAKETASSGDLKVNKETVSEPSVAEKIVSPPTSKISDSSSAEHPSSSNKIGKAVSTSSFKAPQKNAQISDEKSLPQKVTNAVEQPVKETVSNTASAEQTASSTFNVSNSEVLVLYAEDLEPYMSEAEISSSVTATDMPESKRLGTSVVKSITKTGNKDTSLSDVTIQPSPDKMSEDQADHAEAVELAESDTVILLMPSTGQHTDEKSPSASEDFQAVQAQKDSVNAEQFSAKSLPNSGKEENNEQLQTGEKEATTSTSAIKKLPLVTDPGRTAGSSGKNEKLTSVVQGQTSPKSVVASGKPKWIFSLEPGEIIEGDVIVDPGISSEEGDSDEFSEDEEVYADSDSMGEIFSYSGGSSDEHDSDEMFFDSSENELDYIDAEADGDHMSSPHSDPVSDHDSDIFPPITKADCPPITKDVFFDPELTNHVSVTTGTQNAKRARACGKCMACNAEDCRKCIYCQDMKKYGGAGKMKQKCKDKQCSFMKKVNRDRNGQELEMQFDSDNTPDTPELVTTKAQSGRKPKSTAKSSDITQYLAPKEEIEVEFKPEVEFSNIPKKGRPKAPRTYEDMIRAEASKVRKLPNCGECPNCCDKTEFGGPGKKKQMCTEKKSQLQQRVAMLAAEYDDKGNADVGSSSGKVAHGRTSSRKRKLTQKMEESLNQEWTDVVKAKMLSISDYASSLLDNYLESVQDASDESDDGDESAESVVAEESVADELSYDLISEFMDGMDDMLEKPAAEEGADASQEATAGETVSLPTASVAIELGVNDEGQSTIDLTKRSIDESLAEAVVQVQPEIMTLNKAITSPKALKTLLSGCYRCTELSMKGVTAVAKLGLADLPFTLTHLNISGIPELKDQMFSTLIQKSNSDETFLGLQLLDLSNTGVGDNTMRLIAKHLPVLATLNVNLCNRITNVGMTFIANSKRLPSLKEIEMNDCEGIDSDCLKSFVALKGLYRLKSINLNGCPNISLNDIKSFVTSTQELDLPWSHSRRHLTRDLKRKG